MINLCLAEARKLLRHYALVLFTLALPSVAMLLGTLLQAGLVLAAPAGQNPYGLQMNWLQSLLLPWDFVVGRASSVGRLFPLVFMAAACGAEYQAGMWKNLLPGHTRWQVLLAKWVVMIGLAWVAFALMSGVALLGNALVAAALGKPGFWPGAGEDGWGQFWQQWPRYYFLLLLALSLIACMAMLFAMLTRSTTGALVGGVMFIGFEAIFPFIIYLLTANTPNSSLGNLTHLLPSDCFINIHSWWMFNQPYGAEFFNAPPAVSATTSLLILLGWVGVLTALTFWRFQTQDIVE